MNKWINADALITSLEYDISVYEDLLEQMEADGIDSKKMQFDKDCKQNAVELLQQTPGIDLVHCFECEYSRTSKCGHPLNDEINIRDNHYCGYGKRKKGANK